MNRTIAVVVACFTASSAISPAWAAPALTSTAMVKSSLPSDAIDVQFRRRAGRNLVGAITAGVALGVIGAIVATQSNPYYYQPGYYGPEYPSPVYVAPPVIYAPAPVYAAPPTRSDSAGSQRTGIEASGTGGLADAEPVS